MKVTPKERTIIDRFNSSLAARSTTNTRPTDAELAKMTDAEVLAGNWLVDIEDRVFWDRWDEANSNLTLEIETKVAKGLASHYSNPLATATNDPRLMFGHYKVTPDRRLVVPSKAQPYRD